MLGKLLKLRADIVNKNLIYFIDWSIFIAPTGLSTEEKLIDYVQFVHCVWSIALWYPRPVLAFGYCHRLGLLVCVSVCVCVNHKLVRTITHRPFKLGSPNMQSSLVWVSIVFGDDRPWPSKSNLTWKSNFTSFWDCSHHNSSAVQARITNFGPKLILALLESLSILDLIGFDLHFHF